VQWRKTTLDMATHPKGTQRCWERYTFHFFCTPVAQRQFDRAVAMLHWFWYDEAEKAFAEVAAIDSECGMAYWGMAMSVYRRDDGVGPS
jgi:hypothetical protein